MAELWKEFKGFALRGNLIDLAIAFILATAFTAVITSLVNDIFMPIIGAIVSDDSFANLSFTLGGVSIFYGNFITAIIYFLLVALVLFMVVKAVNQMKKNDPPADTKVCPYCTTTIALSASRCPACTSQLSAGAVAD